MVLKLLWKRSYVKFLARMQTMFEWFSYGKTAQF